MTDTNTAPSVEQDFLQAVEEVTKERQLTGAMQDGVKAMPPAQPQGSQDQPGFFQRLYNEVTAPKPAPVAGVDFGTAPDAGTMSAATRVLGSSVESQSEMPRAVIGGAARAVFQTRDFMAGLTGETTDPAARSALRQAVEADYKDVTSRSIPNALAGGISQFVTGLIGAGKLMAPLRATQAFTAGGKAAQVGYEIARGAAAGAVVMDPHEARLSNMIQEFPALENPVSEYLAASPDDSAAEGRLKNALEGAGVDLAFAGAFALGLKALKFARRGNTEAAKKVVEEIAQPQVAEEMKAAAERPVEVPPVAPVEKPRVRVKAGSQAASVQIPRQSAP